MFKNSPIPSKSPPLAPGRWACRSAGLAWSFPNSPHTIPSIVFFCHIFCNYQPTYSTLLHSFRKLHFGSKKLSHHTKSKKTQHPFAPLRAVCARKKQSKPCLNIMCSYGYFCVFSGIFYLMQNSHRSHYVKQAHSRHTQQPSHFPAHSYRFRAVMVFAINTSSQLFHHTNQQNSSILLQSLKQQQFWVTVFFLYRSSEKGIAVHSIRFHFITATFILPLFPCTQNPCFLFGCVAASIFVPPQTVRWFFPP